jgi:hypothetical protein
MFSEDEYRAKAGEAQAFAERAKTDSDRAAWLQIAAGWMSLVKPPLATARKGSTPR